MSSSSFELPFLRLDLLFWFLCHCELIHSVEESYLEGQAQEAPCLQEIPCGKLVWRWSKDGPSVLCVTTRRHSLMQKKRRRLVLSLQKTVVIQSYHWAQSESHTAGVKAPWWAHRATIQVGVKLCNAGNLPSGTVGAVQRILLVCFQFALRACGHATRSFTELVGRSSSICLQDTYA